MENNNIGSIFSQLKEEAELKNKKNKYDDMLEKIEEIEIDDITNILTSLLPKTKTNSYSLDRNIINTIDYINTRLLPINTKATRSDIVNGFLDFLRVYYHNNKKIEIIKEHSFSFEELNIESCRKYFEITRKETDIETIKKFGLPNETGKQSVKIDLTKVNLLFLKDIVESDKKLNYSKVLNSILNKLFFK